MKTLKEKWKMKKKKIKIKKLMTTLMHNNFSNLMISRIVMSVKMTRKSRKMMSLNVYNYV